MQHLTKSGGVQIGAQDRHSQGAHRRLPELYNLCNSSERAQGWSIHVIANCNDGPAEWLCCLLCLLLDLEWPCFVICASLTIVMLIGSFACNTKAVWFQLRCIQQGWPAAVIELVTQLFTLLSQTAEFTKTHVTRPLQQGTTWQMG